MVSSAKGGEPTQRFSVLQQQLLTAAIHFFYRHIRSDADVLQRMEGNQMFWVFFEVQYHDNKPDLNPIFPESVNDTSPLHVCSFILSILHQGIFSVSAFIVSVIYLSRFKESSHITLHACTWRPLFLTALLLADKVWEDKPVRNSSLAKLFPVLSNAELNRMEREFLGEIRFNVLMKPDLFCSFCEKLLGEQAHAEITRCVNSSQYAESLQADLIEPIPSSKALGDASFTANVAVQQASPPDLSGGSNSTDPWRKKAVQQGQPGQQGQRAENEGEPSRGSNASRGQGGSPRVAGSVAAPHGGRSQGHGSHHDPTVPRSQSEGPIITATGVGGSGHVVGPRRAESSARLVGSKTGSAHSHTASAHALHPRTDSQGAQRKAHTGKVEDPERISRLGTSASGSGPSGGGGQPQSTRMSLPAKAATSLSYAPVSRTRAHSSGRLGASREGSLGAGAILGSGRTGSGHGHGPSHGHGGSAGPAVGAAASTPRSGVSSGAGELGAHHHRGGAVGGGAGAGGGVGEESPPCSARAPARTPGSMSPFGAGRPGFPGRPLQSSAPSTSSSTAASRQNSRPRVAPGPPSGTLSGGRYGITTPATPSGYGITTPPAPMSLHGPPGGPPTTARHKPSGASQSPSSHHHHSGGGARAQSGAPTASSSVASRGAAGASSALAGTARAASAPRVPTSAAAQAQSAQGQHQRHATPSAARAPQAGRPQFHSHTPPPGAPLHTPSSPGAPLNSPVPRYNPMTFPTSPAARGASPARAGGLGQPLSGSASGGPGLGGGGSGGAGSVPPARCAQPPGHPHGQGGLRSPSPLGATSAPIGGPLGARRTPQDSLGGTRGRSPPPSAGPGGAAAALGAALGASMGGGPPGTARAATPGALVRGYPQQSMQGVNRGSFGLVVHR